MVVLFCISIFLIFHSYVLYPILLWILMGITKRARLLEYSPTEELPMVSVLVAAYNEELVISNKIESIFSSTYPQSRLEVIVGSDGSSDQTNSIVNSLIRNHINLKLVEFTDRQGKVNVINRLVDVSQGSIIISTDANVYFDNDTIFKLVKHMKDPSVGLVDSRMVNTGLKRTGISIQESIYITYEVMVKYREGMLWGNMIGPFGGGYAVRKELFVKPPLNFLVDDFYINMKVLEQGKRCINNLKANVFEDVSNDLSEEFRRKVRISTGNFQNLKAFSHLLWPPYRPIAFAFFSHKVLRWLGPILIFCALASSGILALDSKLYLGLFLAQIAFLALPLIDVLLKSIGIHILPLRFATHFISMNVALLIGLIKYLKGVESNVWQPTRRQQ